MEHVNWDINDWVNILFTNDSKLSPLEPIEMFQFTNAHVNDFKIQR